MFREIRATQIEDVLRRWQAGQGAREIARQTRLDRKTVRRYIRAAEAERLGAGSALGEAQVTAVKARVQERPPPGPSPTWRALSGVHDKLRSWVQGEAPLRLSRVQRLLEGEGVMVSYATLWRYTRRELGPKRGETPGPLTRTPE